jgi:hypothetical protein
MIMPTTVSLQGLKDADARLVQDMIERLRNHAANGHADQCDELPEPTEEQLDAIYEALSLRYTSGRTDAAARHNEHQP